LALRRLESNTEEITIDGQVGSPINTVELKKYLTLVKDVNDDFEFNRNDEKGIVEIPTVDLIPGISITNTYLEGVNSTDDIISS
jgi:hypothetical protein